MAPKTLLIVEDKDYLLRLESIFLSLQGFRVIEADDGQAALEAVATERPDLVLLDVMLPVVDGLEICRRIKQDPATRHIPVVMLTARSSHEDRLRGLAAGADAYITKPFRTNEVVDTVQRCLAGAVRGSVD